MFALLSHAQSTHNYATENATNTHVEFGLKGGLNIAELHNNDADYKSRISFNAGGLAHIHFSRYFALQPELMYSGQGRKLTVEGRDIKTKLSYINMPVLLQYMVNNSGLRVQTGPQIGWLVNAKSEVNDQHNDIKDNFKNTDFSWVFGTSYLTRCGFGVDARYNLGINNINKNEDNSSNKLKNSVFAVGVFYQFKAI